MDAYTRRLLALEEDIDDVRSCYSTVTAVATVHKLLLSSDDSSSDDELQERPRSAPTVPRLSRERHRIAELAWFTQPVLLWQLSLRLRKLGVRETAHFADAMGQFRNKYEDPKYAAKIRRAAYELVTSKGAPAELATKAASQWHRITHMVALCKSFNYHLGQNCLPHDEDELCELEELIQQPELEDVREATQLMILVAHEIVSAGR